MRHILLLIVTHLVVLAASEAVRARDILAACDVSGGLVVHLHCGDARLSEALQGGHESVVVHGLTSDPLSLQMARNRAVSLGRHGALSYDLLQSERLPYADRLVRLLVSEDPGAVPRSEILRVLSPGGKAWIGGQVIEKPWPESIDTWTHYFYDASNNQVSTDREVGPPRALRWKAGPVSSRSHNWVTSTDSFVSAGGKIFYLHDDGPIAVQGQQTADMNWAIKSGQAAPLQERWSLVARDAFNGIELWRRALSDFGHMQFEEAGPSQPTMWNIWSSPLQLHRRVICDEDRVYATLAYRGGLSALDPASGEQLWHYAAAETAVDEVIKHEDALLLRLRAAIPGKFAQPIGNQAPDPSKAWQQWLPPERFDAMLKEAGDEWLACVDPTSGRERWRVAVPRLATESLCASSDALCYHDGEAVVCRALADGQQRWRSTPLAPMKGRGSTWYRSGIAGTCMIAEGIVVFAGAGTQAFDLASGEQLWTAGPMIGGGFGHPTGLRSFDGALVADRLTRLRLADGEALDSLGVDVAIGSTHGRCHRSIATARYLSMHRFGIEFVERETGRLVSDDRWLRSECAVGYVPANGLLYNMPDPCACWMGSRMRGFHGLAAEAPAVDHQSISGAERYERGPAAERVFSAATDPADWPAYRHDGGRSGRAGCAVDSDLSVQWQTQLGGRLSQPVVSGDAVVVSRIDDQEIVCLDRQRGRVRWRHATGGRVDSAPALHQGRVLFGSDDGRVSCLALSDGAQVWRFRAAVADIRIVDENRLASKWPVHGAVLVDEDSIVCTAGHSSFLDGGLHIYRLALADGSVLAHQHLDGPWHDPQATNDLIAPEKKHGRIQEQWAGAYQGIDIDGARSDILVDDGRFIHMGSTRLDRELNATAKVRLAARNEAAGQPHLRAINGLLDDSFFHRNGWHFSDRYYGGGNAAGAANAGKILVVDEDFTYASQHEGLGSGRYPNHVPGEGALLVVDRIGARNQADGGFGVNRRQKPQWQQRVPLLVRAMVLSRADERRPATWFVSGPVETGAEDLDAVYRFETPGSIWALDARDGSLLGSSTLSASPVFDGLIAAQGALFASLVDGSLVCLAGSAEEQVHRPPLHRRIPLDHFNRPLRDPALSRGPDGDWWLTGTSSTVKKSNGEPDFRENDGVYLWRSADLTSWEDLGCVMAFRDQEYALYGAYRWLHKVQVEPDRPGSALHIGAIAPEIHYAQGAWWLCLSILRQGTALLTAEAPSGPWQLMDLLTTRGGDPSLAADGERLWWLLDGRIAPLVPGKPNKFSPKGNDPHLGLGQRPTLLCDPEGRPLAERGAFFFPAAGRWHLLATRQALSPQGERRWDTTISSADSPTGPFDPTQLLIPGGGQASAARDDSGRILAACIQDHELRLYDITTACVETVQ